MAQEFGEISDNSVYTAETLAKRIGRNPKLTKEMLRDHFHIVDYGTLILISGLDFRLGVERMARCAGEDAGADPPQKAAVRAPKKKVTP